MQKGPSNTFKVSIVFSVLLYVVCAAEPYWPRRVYECDHSCSCRANLMQIESAKEQWALDNHKKQGAKVTLHYLVGATLYIKAKPTCLKGGLYLINRVGDNPTCMHEGHVLPQ